MPIILQIHSPEVDHSWKATVDKCDDDDRIFCCDMMVAPAAFEHFAKDTGTEIPHQHHSHTYGTVLFSLAGTRLMLGSSTEIVTSCVIPCEMVGGTHTIRYTRATYLQFH